MHEICSDTTEILVIIYDYLHADLSIHQAELVFNEVKHHREVTVADLLM